MKARQTSGARDLLVRLTPAQYSQLQAAVDERQQQLSDQPDRYSSTQLRVLNAGWAAVVEAWQKLPVAVTKEYRVWFLPSYTSERRSTSGTKTLARAFDAYRNAAKRGQSPELEYRTLSEWQPMPGPRVR